MKKIVLLLLTLIVSGCSTMQPPRYAVSVDNIQSLKSLDGSQLKAEGFTMSAEFKSGCRLMGPIEPADGLSIPAFISKAFNDELKMAEKYSETGVKITGDVTKVAFKSTSGANWEIAIKLMSSNGNSLETSNVYNFKSGFDAVTACNATADALSPAVQDLIQKIINHSGFPSLLKQ
ncbi:MAG: hypothetical protein AB8B80_08110 [Marinicellaceae bacterium]